MGNTEDELVSQRASIESCFDQVRCFLMPYPGEIVATSKEFRGKLSGEKSSGVPRCASYGTSTWSEGRA